MKRTLAPFLRCLALLACLAVPLHARAHRLSDSLLRLEPAGDHWSGCLDLPLRDLSLLVELDPNRDGQITWGEVRNALPAITAQLEQHLQFRHGERTLALSQPDLAISRLAGEPCASIAFRIDAPAATALDVRYSLLFDQDPAHRGLLRFQDGERVETRVFGPDAPAHRLESVAPGSPARTDPAGNAWLTHLREGIHHIWIGTDHILFLLALLLPAVLRRHDDQDRQPGREPGPAERFPAVLKRVIQLVTAFTLAHSITLVLATLGLVQLPSRLVESVIAASVAVAALNNLRPFLHDRGLVMAFGFGLIHGFGFASVLQDLELPRTALASSLIGFNLGVEIGQLAIVAVFLPVAYALRETWAYRRAVFQLGSFAILILAVTWFAERAFNLELTGI